MAAALLLSWPEPSAAQVRACADLADEIAAGLIKRNVTFFTLLIVAPGEVGERRVVGSCQGGTRRIVFEPRGSGKIVPEAESPKPKPSPPPVPALKELPTAPVAVVPKPVAAPSVPPADPLGPLSVRAVDPSAAPRSLSRPQLASLRKLIVDEGADDRDTLEEFVANLRISGLPDLTSTTDPSRDFVLVESAQRDALSAFTLVTSNGTVILAERSAWLMGLLPEQHGGLHDVCLLVRDVPAPGANYSDWTAEFNGTRYVKKTRQFKSESCLDRVTLKITR